MELRITRVEAREKLSQKHSAAYVDGVVRGTRANGALALAYTVQAARSERGAQLVVRG